MSSHGSYLVSLDLSFHFVQHKSGATQSLVIKWDTYNINFVSHYNRWNSIFLKLPMLEKRGLETKMASSLSQDSLWLQSKVGICHTLQGKPTAEVRKAGGLRINIRWSKRCELGLHIWTRWPALLGRLLRVRWPARAERGWGHGEGCVSWTLKSEMISSNKHSEVLLIKY